VGVREKLWYYCPRPIKRTGPYIVRAFLRFEKEMVSGKFMKWLAISLYIAFLLFTWLDYSVKLTGYTTLESALLYTLIAPLLTLAGFKIHQIKSFKLWQILWTVFGAAVFGFAIFAAITFLLNRVFSLPVWAETPSAFLTFAVSYVIGTYLGYRFGKRRGFRPLIF
jgi:hypothetical protein